MSSGKSPKRYTLQQTGTSLHRPQHFQDLGLGVDIPPSSTIQISKSIQSDEWFGILCVYSKIGIWEVKEAKVALDNLQEMLVKSPGL